jgi:hypothetical protein
MYCLMNVGSLWMDGGRVALDLRIMLRAGPC